MDSFGIQPAAARLGASSHMVLRQELIRRLARWMPPFMFLPVFAGIAAMMLCRTSVFWTLDALGLAVIVYRIRALENRPLAQASIWKFRVS